MGKDIEVMIPFYRPPKNLAIEELLPDWAQIYDCGMLSNSENCKQLEERIKVIHKCDHVFSCGSATSGLWILLNALKPKHIAMSAFTWKSVEPVTGFYPRTFMDISRSTWLPNIFSIASMRHVNIDTFLIQHTFGSICKLEVDVSEKIIHDAAYSLGLSFPVNDGAVISMSPTKTVTAAEGGLILVNDDKVANMIEELRDTCSRLSEFNAVLALHYLEKLPEILAAKKEICEYYQNELPYGHQAIPVATTYGYYGMLLPEGLLNERFREKGKVFSINGVECRVRYEPLIDGLPNTDYVAKHVLCLPCYLGVNKEEVVERIIEWPHI